MDPAGTGAPVRVVGSPRAVIWAWEKLRLKYNLFLAVPGAAILFFYMYRLDLPFGGAASGGFVIAIGANLCFFLGPLSEIYASALFDKSEMPEYRKIAFWLGVLGSFGLFLFTVIPGVFYL